MNDQAAMQVVQTGSKVGKPPTTSETFDIIQELLDHARSLTRERPDGISHGDGVIVGKRVRELKRQVRNLRAFVEARSE